MTASHKKRFAELCRALAKYSPAELEAFAAELDEQAAAENAPADGEQPRKPRRIDRAELEATLRKKGIRLAQ